MKKQQRKNILIAGGILLALSAATWGLVVLDAHNRAAAIAQAQREIRLAARPPAPDASPLPARATQSPALPAVAPVRRTPVVLQRNPHPAPPPIAHPANTPVAQPPAIISEPMARDALLSVGASDQATRIWTTAINDPSIPANQRKDLIEDLNHDGFADPRNLTPGDLALIDSRLSLIEQLAPDAMDDTNYAAFQEAYKDLLNMRARLVQP